MLMTQLIDGMGRMIAAIATAGLLAAIIVIRPIRGQPAGFA
jgi:hypothetical protein